MGFDLNWFAVRDKTADAVCGGLGLRRSGERTDFPSPRYAGAELAGGWYLVVEESARAHVGDAWDLADISKGCEVAAFSVAETAGYAELLGWRDGELVWAVRDDPDTGLDLTGDFPAELAGRIAEVRAQLAAASDPDDVDLGDLPTDLGKAYLGFEYDGLLGAPGDARFERLDATV
ncbi:hypothetical protein [Nocardia stercoris]|uniref:Uncharacterized protein n=1 Tax=Nocardia stercoris TaxID=2483361 RepID=A0A3M2L8F1_9NOCA|nr:hypothetical protein [Nocardia stercoris]RMI32793.1 hypothetical protein EBN03_12715 [Nocardia stercoris]